MFNVNRKRYILIIILASCVISGFAQQRKVQHKPYIDLRPLHFGILVGAHLQDIEFENVGLQTIVDEQMEPWILRWCTGRDTSARECRLALYSCNAFRCQASELSGLEGFG